MRRLAIVGGGLIGGSVALAASARLPKIGLAVLDRDDPLEGAADADLIILATPIGEIVRLLGALKPIVSPHALITDTGSTKAAIVSAAAGMRFIGGHPIAGAGTGGRAAARADLFEGRPWVLTPAADAGAGDLDRLRAFVESLGAHAHMLDAVEHDRLFAFTSHLPQLVVSALMDVVGSRVGAEGLALAGAGLRDTTRLAGSPPDIWREIVRTNDANVGPALDALIAALTALRAGSGDALAATFERAGRWRAVLEGAERPERHHRGGPEDTATQGEDTPIRERDGSGQA